MKKTNMQDIWRKRWLTPTELEFKYGISKSTQAKYRIQGKIIFSKIGKYIRYDTSQIDRWLEDHEIVGLNLQ